ncbi:hypothetical protein LCGC14_1313890 [marine sediment metagenome]|uniref:Uncharacterized protein n=1 Tax=marine sediment metagenome TaxID=412755 RepID=A0A0F9KLF5_9ZZZZ
MNYRTLYSRLHRHYTRSEHSDFLCAYCSEENPYGYDHIPSLFYLNKNGRVEHGHKNRYKVFFFLLPDGTRAHPSLVPACRKCVQTLSEATDLITFKDRKNFLKRKKASNKTIGEIFGNQAKKPENRIKGSRSIFLRSIEKNLQKLKREKTNASN